MMPDKVVRLADVEDMLTNAQIISDGEYNGYCTEDIHLSMLPIADYAPVVHAHWIPKKEMIRSPYAKNYNCSACGKESYAYPNCPFCRAIMDEVAKK